jgi:hypothetical protein
MNLATAKTIIHNQNVAKEAWLNGTKIWSNDLSPASVWTFPTATGTTITEFSIETEPSGTILVDWGDSTSNTIDSGSLVNKTY